MGQWNSFSAFSKVKIEIISLVDEVLSTVEALLEPTNHPLNNDSEDDGRYEQCRLNLKQIADVLRVMKHFELALLVDEMLALFVGIENVPEGDANHNRIESLQLLFVTINDFPAILEKTLAENNYSFENYLSSVNKIRELRGVSQIFTSEVLVKDASTNYRKLILEQSQDIDTKFRKELSSYKKSIQVIVSGQNQKQGIDELYLVFSSLEVICRDYKIGTLWGICVGLLESMTQLSAKENSEILKKLCSFSSILEKIVNEGASTLSKTLPHKVLMGLLDFISLTENNTERLASIKRHFNLDANLTDKTKADYRDLLIQYFRKETSVTAINLVLEELLVLSDSINAEVNEQGKTKEEYCSIESDLEQIKNTIQALGFSLLANQFETELVTLHECIDRFDDLTSQDKEKTLFKLAQLLYKIEVTLSAKIEDLNKGVLASSNKKQGVEVLSGAKNNLIQEAINNLDSISIAIDHYVDSACDVSELGNVSAWLAEILAAVNAVPLTHAAKFVAGAHTYIDRLISSNRKLHIEKSFHNFVSLLINTRFYLERIAVFPSEELEGKVFAMNAMLNDLESFSFDVFEALENTEPELTQESSVVETSVTAETITAEVAEIDAVDDEIKLIFIEETDELLPLIDESMQALLSQNNDKEAMAELRRAFHTLKGSGRLVGANCLGEVSWHVESLLNKVISGSIPFDDRVSDLVTDVRALLPAFITAFAESDESAFTLSGATPVINMVNAIVSPEKAPIVIDEIEKVETVEAVEVADTVEVAEVAETVEVAEVAETVEVAEVAETVEVAEVTETIEVAEVAEIKETVEFAQVIEIEDVSEVQTVAETVDVAEVAEIEQTIEFAPVTEIEDVAEVTEVTETVDVAEVAEIEETVEFAAVTEIIEVAEVAEVTKFAQFTEIEEVEEVEDVTEAEEIVEFTDVIEAADIAELTEVIDVEVAAEAAEAAQFAEAIEETSIIQEPVIADRTESIEAVSNDTSEETVEEETFSKMLYKFDVAETKQVDSVENDLIDVFLTEAERQIGRVRNYLANPQTLDDNGRAITTTSFSFPVHTLYGNSKAVYFEGFTHLISPLETLLQDYPHQQIGDQFKLLFKLFCDMTQNIIDEVRQTGTIPESGHSIKDSAMFLELLEKVEYDYLQRNQKQSIFSKTIATVKNKLSPSSTNKKDTTELVTPESNDSFEPELDEQQLLLNGFLHEANATNCLILTMLQGFKQDRSDVAQIVNMQEQLGILEGAARLAEQLEVSQMCLGLSSIYQRYINREFNFSDPIFSTLESCHQYISYALDSIEKKLDLNDPAEFLSALTVKITDEAKVQADEAALLENDEIEEELLATFLEEAEELLQQLDEKASLWHSSPSDKSITDDLLRSLHTLKGSAALVNVNEMSELAHNFESCIIASMRSTEALDSAFFNQVDAQLHALQKLYSLYQKDDSGHIIKTEITDDDLRALVGLQAGTDSDLDSDNAENSESVLEASADKVVSEQVKTDNVVTLEPVRQVLAPAKPAPSTSKASESTGAKSSRSSVVDEQVRVSSKLLKTLLNDADQNNIIRSRIEQNMTDFHDLLGDMDDTLGRLLSYIRKFEEHSKSTQVIEAELDEALAPGEIKDEQEFDALEMDKYTESQQLSSSLFEDYNDLCELRDNFSRRVKNTDGLLEQQQRFINSLQEGLISSQMVPFSGIVPRLERLTRQVSADLGKKVEIKFGNPEGKIDRSILQAMVVPLEHMIRNAIDHGIEMPMDRLKKAKSETGVILVKLYRQGPNIILDIIDDGGGIDVAAIKRQARANGLLEADDLISDQQAFQFLFKSGFSTTQKVSKISGRGVGMDIVYSDIKHIGGEVEIDSTHGVGTTFSVRLPFTSSLNRALLFNVNGDSFAILLNTIDGIILETTENLSSYYTQEETPLIEYSDNSYELRYMGSMLDDSARPSFTSPETTAPILLISGKEHHMALQVDSVVGSRDLVIKSLGPQFSSINGLSGAVILGDGNIVMVLDPKALVDSAKDARDVVLKMNSVMGLLGKDTARKGTKTVLVVDDSITVRKVTSSILERNGMTVILAKNGFDAIEILQHTVPDVMLLDIEMPKMDGFEVASFIRRQETSVRDVPIIMITSRIGEKHRTRAQEIGVNQYMCKPFQEENLLEAIAEYN